MSKTVKRVKPVNSSMNKSNWNTYNKVVKKIVFIFILSYLTYV